MAECPNKDGIEPVAKESMESIVTKQAMGKDVSEDVIEPITKEAAKSITPEDLMCENFTCILRASDHRGDDVNFPAPECRPGFIGSFKRKIRSLVRNE